MTFICNQRHEIARQPATTLHQKRLHNFTNIIHITTTLLAFFTP
jgi:hypothetical protein